jgi:hypothetical protein
LLGLTGAWLGRKLGWHGVPSAPLGNYEEADA